MGSARVGSNPIGVAVALHAGADVFAPNHDHRTTNLHCDGSPLQLPTVTVAILAQGTSWADAATQAYFDALPPPRVHCTKRAEQKNRNANPKKTTNADSTLRSSQAVPHPSTNRALRHLTSEFRRDPVHWTRYGRQRRDIFGSLSPTYSLSRSILTSFSSCVEPPHVPDILVNNSLPCKSLPRVLHLSLTSGTPPACFT